MQREKVARLRASRCFDGGSVGQSVFFRHQRGDFVGRYSSLGVFFSAFKISFIERSTQYAQLKQNPFLHS